MTANRLHARLLRVIDQLAAVPRGAAVPDEIHDEAAALLALASRPLPRVLPIGRGETPAEVPLDGPEIEALADPRARDGRGYPLGLRLCREPGDGHQMVVRPGRLREVER